MIDSPSPELQDVVDIFSTIKQVCALCLMDFTSLCLRAHRGARRHDASISTYMPCLALPACHRARHLTTDPSGMRNTRIRANQFKTNDCNVARARSLSLRHVTIIFFPPRPQFHRYSLIYYTSAHSQAQFQHYKVYADHTLIAAVHHGGCSFRVISIQYQLTVTMRSNFRPVDKIQNLPDSPSPELSGVYSPYRLRVDDVASHTEQPRRCSSKSPAMARSSGFMTHPLYQLARARRMVTNTTFGAVTSRGISD